MFSSDDPRATLLEDEAQKRRGIVRLFGGKHKPGSVQSVIATWFRREHPAVVRFFLGDDPKEQ